MRYNEPVENQKDILILGAGFAGLRSAIRISKKLPKKLKQLYRIVLVDEHPVHVYTPDIYSIATAFHKKITKQCLIRLTEEIATPINKAITGHNISFLRDSVTRIEPENQRVILKNIGDIDYEYLVLALGSVTNYFDIPGLKEYSYPLKTLSDALAINCHLDLLFAMLREDRTLSRKISIVVGGGGTTGVEFGCALREYVDKLCVKYGVPKENISIALVEAGKSLAGQDMNTTSFIKIRLHKLGVTALLETRIKKVENAKITVEKDIGIAEFPVDAIIWTGGVAPNPIIAKCFKETSRNGALIVNDFLQYEAHKNIFAAGDNAYFVDPKSKKCAPMLAQVAIKQADIVAENVVRQTQGKKLKRFSLKVKGIVVPLGGHRALYKFGFVTMDGFLAWMLARLIDLVYSLSILPAKATFKKLLRRSRIFANDE